MDCVYNKMNNGVCRDVVANAFSLCCVEQVKLCYGVTAVLSARIQWVITLMPVPIRTPFCCSELMLKLYADNTNLIWFSGAVHTADRAHLGECSYSEIPSLFATLVS